MNTKNYIIDTSVILEGLEYIINAIKDGNNVFITDIILQELDGKKSEEGKIGFNARKFFRMMSSDNGTAYYTTPGTDKSLQKGDSLRKMSLSIEDKNMPIYVFVRSNYKTRNINDSKIIEVAKDYGLTLLTRDMAQKVRALSDGVEVEMVDTNIKRIKLKEIVFLVIFWFLSIVLSTVLFGDFSFGILLSALITILYLNKENILEPGYPLIRPSRRKREFGEGWAYMSYEKYSKTGVKWLS